MDYTMSPRESSFSKSSSSLGVEMFPSGPPFNNGFPEELYQFRFLF